jgi:hypothetical protein
MSKSHAPEKTSQLAKWASDFGAEYAERNAFAEWRMIPGTEAFRRMMGGRDVDSVLEVGCSVGLNLIFINALFAGRVQRYGASRRFNSPEHGIAMLSASLWPMPQ